MFGEQCLEKCGERNAALDGFDENDDLVEFEGVEEVEQFSIFFALGQFARVLLQTVQGQFRFVINKH